MESVKQDTVCKEPLLSVKIKVALGLRVCVKIHDASYGSLRRYHKSNGTDARDQRTAYTKQRQE